MNFTAVWTFFGIALLWDCNENWPFPVLWPLLSFPNLLAGWQYTALTYSFSYLEPVCCSMSSSNCCFLACIQISQEPGQVVWYSHPFQNCPQFIVIHTVKCFGIVNKAEVDFFGGDFNMFAREDNGTPLQYSCLENPMDRGAWWAAVYRVAQSQTRLKWLSSSSSSDMFSISQE